MVSRHAYLPTTAFSHVEHHNMAPFVDAKRPPWACLTLRPWPNSRRG
jgi:hypothetical protein